MINKDDLYTVCMDCGRVKINDEWSEITDELKEILKNKLESHGLCDECSERRRL